jgi:hypothetical protein
MIGSVQSAASFGKRTLLGAMWSIALEALENCSESKKLVLGAAAFVALSIAGVEFLSAVVSAECSVVSAAQSATFTARYCAPNVSDLPSLWNGEE